MLKKSLQVDLKILRTYIIMVFFKKKSKKNKKQEDFIDLRKYHLRNQEKLKNLRQEIQDEKQDISGEDRKNISPGFSFFDNPPSVNNSQQEDTFINLSELNEKKKKLAKRIAEMTTKIEDLSNQVYHIQQRLELIERKLDVNRF